MQANFSARPVMLSIAAVERDTGLSKDTLRVWERRYGFPSPARDALGERSYSFDQVEKLRTVKRLLDAGHRPGRVVSMSADDLNRLAATIGAPASVRESLSTPSAPTEDVKALVDTLRANDIGGLRHLLATTLSRIGLGRFVLEVVAPLNAEVGEAWMQGRLEVFQEHLYTESIQVVLRDALHHLPSPLKAAPHVLLGTVSGEPHGLGLLMAEAVMALDGCRCTSLGVQTPVWDIVRAASALSVDIVALSYTGCTNPNHVVDGLTELRTKLSPSIALWVGGNAPVLHRRPVEGVRVIPSLDRLPPTLADWRRERSGTS